MKDDLATAFAHPAARAAATAQTAPRDRISMTDHVRDVEIGAFQSERGVTQKIRFDVVVEVASRAESATDDVDRILSYDTIVEAIDHSLAAERVNLLETLAARIAEAILTHPLAERVFVRIGKLDRGPFTLGVEIVRESPANTAPAETAPRPLVVYLSRAAIHRADLSALLDRLEALETPLILCVDSPAGAPPAACHPMPARRIALLAIEQSAWVLAARDPRCVVVDSRTELDHALRHGAVSVWAPSRLVLDAFDGPPAHVTQPMALAAWLADSFAAKAFIVFGPEPKATFSADALPGLADLQAFVDRA